MTLAVLAAAAYGGVLAWCCILAPRVAPVTATLGGAGACLLLLVLVRGLDDLLPPAVLLLGAGYLLALLAGQHPLDDGAPLVGTALLACGELATWSLEQRPSVPAARQLVLARVGALAVLLFAGLAASALVLAVAVAPIGSGLGWTLLGTVAAVLAVGVTARIASRGSS